MFPAISPPSIYREDESHRRQRKPGTSNIPVLPKFPKVESKGSKYRKAQGPHRRAYNRTLGYTSRSVASDPSHDEEDDVRAVSPVGDSANPRSGETDTTNHFLAIEFQKPETHREQYDQMVFKKTRGLDLASGTLGLPKRTGAYLRRRAQMRKYRTPTVITDTNIAPLSPPFMIIQGRQSLSEISQGPDQIEFTLDLSRNVSHPAEEQSVNRRSSLRESISSSVPRTPETIENNDQPHSEHANDDLSDSDEELTRPMKRIRPVHRRSAAEIYETACRLKKITPISKFLKQLGQRTIELRNHLLGPMDMKGIAIALSSQQEVKDFDISGNNFGAQGTQYLSQILLSKSGLAKLAMSATFPGVEGCLSLSETLLDNTSLTILKLGENALGEQHIAHLAKYIRVTRVLRELYLNHNQLDETGGKILGPALAQNKSIQVLDLTWNHLRRGGAEAICKALEVNSTLEELNFSWNGFSTEGCKCLATVLPKNDTLRHLNISSNRINMKALLYFLQGLIRNEGITSLKIGKNPLTTEGATILVEALAISDRCRVDDLDLSEVPVDEKFLKAVERLRDKRIVSIRHGLLYRQDVSKQGQTVNSMGIERFDPILVLYEYMKADSLRLVDMFHYFDTDHNGYINKAELRSGFANANIPLTEHNLETLRKSLDTDKDGQIDLQEMMTGHRVFNRIVAERNRIARKRNKPEDASLKELRAIIKKMLTERNEKLKESKNEAEAKSMSVNPTDKLMSGLSKSRRNTKRSRVSAVR